MASITIRNLDDKLNSRLCVHAAKHGRSMEEQARLLLRDALASAEEAPPVHLAQIAESLFGSAHGVELALPARAEARPVPAFSE